jgi:hypothetical protein
VQGVSVVGSIDFALFKSNVQGGFNNLSEKRFKGKSTETLNIQIDA